MCSYQFLTVKSEVFVLNLNISASSSFHISMRNLKILQAAFAVVGVHVIIQLIMYRKPVFTKKEYFLHLGNKKGAENTNSYNRSMSSMMLKLINIEKVKFNFN